MCTAITFQDDDFYFGRTLDYERSFGEEVVITPRNYVFNFRDVGVMQKHYAIIGMAHIEENFPLYYDAVNEKGLCIAALNFVGNAYYREKMPHKDNVAHFEFIPWLLGQCATISQVKEKLKSINVTDTAFSSELKVAELHWIIADKSECITIESVADGLKFYQNPVGVLTNNPPFPEQMFNLKNYMHLSPNPPKNRFSEKLDLLPYSRGMGALGLPGDLSSQSRFVRACFTKLNSNRDNKNAVSQFFHILGTVNQVSGCCVTENGDFEKTIYTSCYNADKGIFYYTTYHNRQITAVDINNENLDSERLISYPLQDNEQIQYQNKK
jgi:choloylglycine hydrolase